VLVNEVKFHFISFAKKAEAFFKMGIRIKWLMIPSDPPKP
tara:strand:- start:161 stop:280 length:120 start_codon:yes stop_codon:yes gene_type:complete